MASGIVKLVVPELDLLATVLRTALTKNFKQVCVEVVESPDLSKQPWGLAARGLNGNCQIADVGGVDNLHYVENNFASFRMSDIAKTVGVANGFLMGPGAGSAPILKVCSELMANTKLDGTCLSKYAIVQPDGSYRQADYPHNEVGVLANLLVSEGMPGKVLHVKASERIGPLNFVSCMRQSLIEHFTEAHMAVGMAGVFQIKTGAIKAHVMPDFPKHDMLNATVVEKWLRFYEMHAPLTCLSVLVSHDHQKLGLRMEHTHFFSDHGDGGHYHHDITPADVDYEGYFVPAEAVHRIGPPHIDPARTCFFS
eukprot:TRINITY_DN18909_c0_g1_i1.p1 TRINITY_DN18909_c0_g1~~TRINITY_DN18909_c0_g1_i1.p1  ORF type:complete len:310 (-),score=-30.09 TRINITY_DN18909_c0_g1_i1:166-1095(-)